MTIIPLGKSFLQKYLTLPNGDSLFHRNFKSNHSHLLILEQLPIFYHDLIKYWQKISYFDPHSIDLILSESLRYNRFMSIGRNTIFLKDFSTIGINKVGDLYDTDLKLIQFEKFVQLRLSSQWYYNWIQLVDSIYQFHGSLKLERVTTAPMIYQTPSTHFTFSVLLQ